jgi:GxxExxY protein
MRSKTDATSYAIIGHAMDVHSELGPGLREEHYHRLFVDRLGAAGIPHQFKPRGELMHRGILADLFEADLIIAEQLILELKVLFGGFSGEHWLQLLCYLKFWKVSVGLLFDFGKERLIHQRMIHVERGARFDLSRFLDQPSGTRVHRDLLETIGTSVQAIIRTYGLGYRDSTYQGLLRADLLASGVSCTMNPLTTVRADGRTIGVANLPCLAISNRCAVLTRALRDSLTAADRAVLQTYLKHIGLAWGVLLNFGKHEVDFRLVTAPRSSSAGI